MGDVPLVDGAVAHVACTLYDEHEAGDHTLYLGEVVSIAERPGEPLLFHGGTFGTMSRELDLAETWGW
jgi:flavin reductase (DIM6/NTAB) family NADH-FMN oxidoreductase RutF